MRHLKLIFLFASVFAAPVMAAESAPHDVMHFRVGHTFSAIDAHARLELLLAYWRERFGVETQWVGNEARLTGRIFGVEFVGSIRVGKNAVTADATDPGLLKRGIAYAYIDKKLKKYMHPTFKEE